MRLPITLSLIGPAFLDNFLKWYDRFIIVCDLASCLLPVTFYAVPDELRQFLPAWCEEFG